ncbi:uncharacterized protein RJT20DRAFT_65730 [Scheffersomyces xylosifermentans]|uniref:uncharacterized protein n=1 Tax=Scheffersomyces xylosifermentans TaxID=1304137 RepID=UPI00315C72B4
MDYCSKDLRKRVRVVCPFHSYMLDHFPLEELIPLLQAERVSGFATEDPSCLYCGLVRPEELFEMEENDEDESIDSEYEELIQSGIESFAANRFVCDDEMIKATIQEAIHQLKSSQYKNGGSTDEPGNNLGYQEVFRQYHSVEKVTNGYEVDSGVLQHSRGTIHDESSQLNGNASKSAENAVQVTINGDSGDFLGEQHLNGYLSPSSRDSCLSDPQPRSLYGGEHDYEQTISNPVILRSFFPDVVE